MSIDEAVRPEGGGTEEPDEPGWEVDPDDDWALAVIATVGRQLRLRREAIGMRVTDFAKAVGYGEDMVYKVESGKRIPRPDYLDTSEKILRADGLVEAMKEDVKKVRYPKKVRDLAQMEAKAVEIGVYECSSIAGLLQTPEYARALFVVRQPPYSVEEVDRLVDARMARLSIFDRSPAPSLSFVLEEATLRRKVGGTMVRRQQFERLLEVGQMNNVTLQVMPMDSVAHPGMSGRIELLKFEDGSAVGRSDGAFNGRPTSEPRQLRILDLRYGTIRAQALPPEKSLPLIERMLGET
ncbi:helix-turn-helix domain-containing protein [Streptomyces sp. e14]|uniref:helix-turn-helix domain-containing protein n=1 Tax=unclassified Streptomyces TaxID=2593676 RepID=UPI0001D0651E|nr:helix-turn-helix transcriptional regulator [Streptomyces sp. e14]EFF92896.1 xre family toxin-antitoxin system, antitoxin component [Streptomyces sp. e14]